MSDDKGEFWAAREKSETAYQEALVRAETREEALHEARLTELRDVVRHRAAVESLGERSQAAYERNTANLEASVVVQERNLHINERVAVALERIAESLSKPVTFVPYGDKE